MLCLAVIESGTPAGVGHVWKTQDIFGLAANVLDTFLICKPHAECVNKFSAHKGIFPLCFVSCVRVFFASAMCNVVRWTSSSFGRAGTFLNISTRLSGGLNHSLKLGGGSDFFWSAVHFHTYFGRDVLMMSHLRYYSVGNDDVGAIGMDFGIQTLDCTSSLASLLSQASPAKGVTFRVYVCSMGAPPTKPIVLRPLWHVRSTSSWNVPPP